MHQPIVTETGQIVKRTKLLDYSLATQLAAILQANARYDAIEIVKSPLTKGDLYFVQYRPTDPGKQAHLFLTLFHKRLDKARQSRREFRFSPQPDGSFRCDSPSGHTYILTEAGCSCGDWEHRGCYIGLACVHMLALGLLRWKGRRRAKGRTSGEGRSLPDLMEKEMQRWASKPCFSNPGQS